MEQSLQVRRIAEADAANYYALRVRSIQELARPAEPEVLRELGCGSGGIVDLFHRYGIEGTRIWGAFDFSVLVGAVGLSRHFPLQHLDTAYLWGMFVLPRYRGTAVSRMLMDAAVGWCEHELRIEWISTRFSRHNIHARQFFERFGFDVADQAKTDGLADWRLRDMAYMRRQV